MVSSAQFLCQAVVDKWKSFMYYVKFIFFGVTLLTFFTLGIPLMYREPGSLDNKRVLCRIAEFISYVLGLKWKMRGKENILDEGAVVVMNHQSFIDALVFRYLVLAKVFTHSVMKKELWYILPVGMVFWLTGSISIDRSDRKKGIEVLDNIAATISKKRIRVLVFPEGTRHGGDKFLPFKKGAFHTAIAAQVPIIPVVVKKYKFVDHKNRSFDSGEGLISILPAIPTEGLKKEDVNDLLEKTFNIMTKEYEALNAEIN